MEPVFSLCVTQRGRYHWIYNEIFYTNSRCRYHWVYNNGIFYPNLCCHQAHGTCLHVIQFVALKPGTASSMESVSSTRCRRPIRWGMLIPARRRMKGQKAPIVVGFD